MKTIVRAPALIPARTFRIMFRPRGDASTITVRITHLDEGQATAALRRYYRVGKVISIHPTGRTYLPTSWLW
jgi:hypothetical protein